MDLTVQLAILFGGKSIISHFQQALVPFLIKKLVFIIIQLQIKI